MVKANFKIYTLRYISEELLSQFIPKVSLLEAQTNTLISFNFYDQFFQIEGEDRKQCEEAAEIINNSLIPILNDEIKSAFDGTYWDIKSIKIIKSDLNNDQIIKNIKQQFTVTGKPLGELDDKEIEEDVEVQGFTVEELSYNPEIIVKEFNISPLIKDIDDFLIGPPQMNMQLAEYIHLIPRLTNTDCTLQRRTIIITGEKSCVDDALDRFKVLQNIYIAHSKVTRVACIHYPHITGHYGLYFCKLLSYRQQQYVHLSQYLLQPYVILPVFFDHEKNEYARPDDLIMLNKLQITPPNNRKIEKIQKIEEIVTSKPNTPDSPPSIIQSAPTTPIVPKTTDIKLTIPNNSNTLPINRPASPPSVMELLISEIPKMDTDTFPVLIPSPPRNAMPSTSHKGKKLFSPKMSNEKVRINRVMRIVAQKSTEESLNQSPSIVTDRVKSYNYNNIKNVLEKGLDSIRGFKGEIRLSARIGKVLWTNVPPSVEENIWKYHEVNDIVMKELGVKPKFSNVQLLIHTWDVFFKLSATIYDNIIERMSSEDVLLQSKPFMKTAIYEFHCQARNQPALQYKKTVIHMNQGVIDVKKVVLKEKITTEIDWVSLDRKFDFQLYIATKQLTRTNVKPYSTFIKTVSICPITRLMSFENIPRFLNVDYVLLKQTTKFKIALPFVVEITRVEQVPLRPVPNTAKINAQPGSGDKVWYEYEVINTMNHTTFEENFDLEVGKEAKWTSKDILNPTIEGAKSIDVITDYVKNMLTIIERIEKIISDTTFDDEGPISPLPSTLRGH